MSTNTYEGWVALTITIVGATEDDPRIDVLSSMLFELGAEGIETKEPPGELVLIASYPPEASPDEEAALALLEALEIDEARIELSQYAAIDWSTHWRQHFHPIAYQSGPRRLDVVPTWLEPPPDAGKILRIDPSSAFGTGLHPTTAMCIERVLELSPVESILDVGTGTGIIALAAVAFGTKRAVGTDIDPEALRVAAENAERNGYTLELSGTEPLALNEKFTVVAANILARPLIELAEEISGAVARGGELILSGITVSQADDVVRAYEACGLEKVGITTREEWARVDLRRSS
jgi:ribosomal protein L11 methyltransferase